VLWKDLFGALELVPARGVKSIPSALEACWSVDGISYAQVKNSASA
jgi:hypothetical protein